eukprot:257303_1
MANIAPHARMQIKLTNESHDSLFKSIDSFRTPWIAKEDMTLRVIGEQQDHYKKEIQSLTNVISISQNKLSALTTEYMHQQKDCTSTEEKINEMNYKIHELSNTKNVILPQQLDQMNQDSTAKVRDLHEKKVKLKSLILKHEIRIKALLSQCRLFETYFGIHCYVVPDTSHVRICFDQINPHDPNKQYSLTLALIDNQYKIIQCQCTDRDDTDAMEYLERRLNSQQIGLSQFIKLTRKYFQLSMQGQTS